MVRDRGVSEVLECGHVAVAEGFGTGYAYVASGARVCYSCADAVLREHMRTADRAVGYVMGELRVGAAFTSWSGGYLGRVVGFSWSYARRERIAHVQVRDVHGRRWYGKYAPDGGQLVGLRAYVHQ